MTDEPPVPDGFERLFYADITPDGDRFAAVAAECRGHFSQTRNVRFVVNDDSRICYFDAPIGENETAWLKFLGR